MGLGKGFISWLLVYGYLNRAMLASSCLSKNYNQVLCSFDPAHRSPVIAVFPKIPYSFTPVQAAGDIP